MDRKKDFKKGLDTDDATSKRKEAVQSIRKEKKEKIISAKRFKGASLEDEASMESTFSPQKLTEICEALKTSSAPKRLAAFKELRKILFVTDPPIAPVLQAGLVPILIEELRTGAASPEAQFEATWCLTNIATGSHDQTGTVLPAAPYLISFLEGSNAILQEQAAWALGNIAGDSQEYRNQLFANGALRPLVNLLSSKVPSLARTAAWTLSNLARGQPPVRDFTSAGIVPHLVKLYQSQDSELVTEVAWVMCFLAAHDDDFIRTYLESGGLPHMVNWICGEDIQVLTPTVRTLGNITSGPNEFTNVVLSDPRVIPALSAKLTSEHRALKKETAWALSNIAGGLPSHVDAIVSSGAVPVLLDLLHTATFDIRKEVAFVLSNMCADGRHLPLLMNQTSLSDFVSFLASTDADLVLLSLRLVGLMLDLHPVEGKRMFEECGGNDALELIEYSPNPDISGAVQNLIEKHFEGNEEEMS